MQTDSSKSRLLYIDNLRALMIIFVVLVHSAVTYSGVGSWYYVENKTIDSGSKLFFFFFQSFTQAYFMSLLFMLAGYFAPSAMDKKGTGKFLADRFFRLGVPFLVYAVILHPISVKLAYPDLNLKDYFIQGISSFEFIGRSGPLWFAFALLLFTVAYVIYRNLFGTITSTSKPFFKTSHIWVIIAIITVLAYVIRIFYPIGTSVINLQFCFFAAYVVMFSFGVWAYRTGIFQNLDYPTGKKWLTLSFAIGIPLWLVIGVLSGVLEGKPDLFGGLNWQAFAYAFWESFFCVSIIIALIAIFKEKFNTQNKFQKFLSDHAFGVFVFHAPILIGISMVLRSLVAPPIVKFIVVGFIALSLSFGFSYLIRKVSFLRKVFS